MSARVPRHPDKARGSAPTRARTARASATPVTAGRWRLVRLLPRPGADELATSGRHADERTAVRSALLDLNQTTVGERCERAAGALVDLPRLLDRGVEARGGLVDPP